jgi:hypothetical protein
MEMISFYLFARFASSSCAAGEMKVFLAPQTAKRVTEEILIIP